MIAFLLLVIIGADFTGWMPFLSPNQHYLSTSETSKIVTCNVLCD